MTFSSEVCCVVAVCMYGQCNWINIRQINYVLMRWILVSDLFIVFMKMFFILIMVSMAGAVCIVRCRKSLSLPSWPPRDVLAVPPARDARPAAPPRSAAAPSARPRARSAPVVVREFD